MDDNLRDDDTEAEEEEVVDGEESLDDLADKEIDEVDSFDDEDKI